METVGEFEIEPKRPRFTVTVPPVLEYVGSDAVSDELQPNMNIEQYAQTLRRSFSVKQQSKPVAF